MYMHAQPRVAGYFVMYLPCYASRKFFWVVLLNGAWVLHERFFDLFCIYAFVNTGPLGFLLTLLLTGGARK